MKITFFCITCSPIMNGVKVEIEDKNYYKITCSRGHDSVMYLGHERFELMFDLGLKALTDGYTREAFLNFSASWESFHKLCLRVFINKADATGEVFEKTWDLVIKQSERQLGAFYFLYLHEFKKPPVFLKRKSVELRNDVVHKSYVPKKEETLSYAKEVFFYIREKYFILKKDYSENLRKISNDDKLHEIIKRADSETHITPTIMGFNSVFGLGSEDDSFEKIVDVFNKCRVGIYSGN